MMKKSLILAVFALTINVSGLSAQMTANAVSGANPRPQAVSGANPRPQAVSGANPRPQAVTVSEPASQASGLWTMVLTIFGL